MRTWTSIDLAIVLIRIFDKLSPEMPDLPDFQMLYTIYLKHYLIFQDHGLLLIYFSCWFLQAVRPLV